MVMVMVMMIIIIIIIKKYYHHYHYVHVYIYQYINIHICISMMRSIASHCKSDTLWHVQNILSHTNSHKTALCKTLIIDQYSTFCCK